MAQRLGLRALGDRRAVQRSGKDPAYEPCLLPSDKSSSYRGCQCGLCRFYGPSPPRYVRKMKLRSIFSELFRAFRSA